MKTHFAFLIFSVILLFSFLSQAQSSLYWPKQDSARLGKRMTQANDLEPFPTRQGNVIAVDQAQAPLQVNSEVYLNLNHFACFEDTDGYEVLKSKYNSIQELRVSLGSTVKGSKGLCQTLSELSLAGKALLQGKITSVQESESKITTRISNDLVDRCDSAMTSSLGWDFRVNVYRAEYVEALQDFQFEFTVPGYGPIFGKAESIPSRAPIHNGYVYLLEFSGFSVGGEGNGMVFPPIIGFSDAVKEYSCN